MHCTKLIAVALGAVTLGSAPAIAACTAADLAGKWQVYSSGAEDGYSSYWVRCTVNVSSSGALSGNCAASSGGGGAVAGRLTLSSPATCTATGQFTLGGTVNKVVHATVARDKNTGNGVGTFPGGNFIFSMTRL
jgi:hypothetical protein